MRLRDLGLVPQRVRMDAQVGGGEVAAHGGLERDLVDRPAAEGACVRPRRRRVIAATSRSTGGAPGTLSPRSMAISATTSAW